MKEKNYLLLVVSHVFIGVGFFFLYVYHVRSIFETRTNFSTLSQLDRESLLRKEDALYFSFYKTIIDAPDFQQGYTKLLNVTTIEYPNSVNVVRRFHVLPELMIGYLFHNIRQISQTLDIPIISCWTLEENALSEPVVICDGIGEPFQFYLEFVWVLGGFTVFILYMYGSFISENIFGGIYAVVSYIIFHKFASKIYDRPVARENFAFPFIFWQMFYLCLSIEKASREKKPKSFRPLMIFKLTLLTTTSLLCWQFSSIIFATQILILITPWSLGLVSSSFSVDYTISQLLSNILAYYFTYENKKYFFSWQNGPAFALLFISLVRIYKSCRPDSTLKTITLGILLAISSQGTIIDLLETSGYAKADDNPYAVYRDLILHWGLQRKVNFTTSLLACNPDYSQVDLNDLWQLLKTLFVKSYCCYGVVVLAKFFRKWRIQEPKSSNLEYVERAKKYVLEDFFEENHISMNDMSNKETEKDLNLCLKLLEECEYDYERYKVEKKKTKKNEKNDHETFINDIKRLKEQILQNNEKKREKTQEGTNKSIDTNNANKSADEQEQFNESNPRSETDNNDDNPKTFRNLSDEPIETDAQNQKEPSTVSGKKKPRNQNINSDPISYHYLYSLAQLAVFCLIGFNIRKLFFLCYTQGCVIVPTVCSKLCYKKQRNVFWAISLIVFLTSILNPGAANVYQEYYPTQSHNDELQTMIEWINMNTEKDAVFGGPVDIIGTVHLITKRPIVNHAHLEMRQISERTESVYSVFSRQQSSDIYNQCSLLKIQYLIISFTDCSNSANDECDILAIWDEMQPAYRKYPQFCSELATKNVPSFLKVFSTDHYGIIKMFSQSVQLNLKQNKMPEKAI